MTPLGRHSASRAARLRALATGQRVLAAVIILIALGLAAYAAAASYDTVSGQAAAHGVPLAGLNPLGIDGGLFGIIIMDITLTWAGCPIWWLRLAARLFAVGTIAANASAGWPDPVGVGLRIAAPALFVIITEAGRTVLLRARHAAERERRETERALRRENRIPRIRWVLDVRGTFALWKRMRLWGEPSYAKAVGIELERLAAIEQLGMKYGPDRWQEKAPADLAWMLRTGVRMTEALARVAELCAPEPEPEPVPVTAPVPAPRRSGPKAGTRSGTARKTAPSDDLALEAKALELLATDLTMSGAELARKLKISPGYGRKLRRRLSGDRPAEAVPDRTSPAPADRTEDRA